MGLINFSFIAIFIFSATSALPVQEPNVPDSRQLPSQPDLAPSPPSPNAQIPPFESSPRGLSNNHGLPPNGGPFPSSLFYSDRQLSRSSLQAGYQYPRPQIPLIPSPMVDPSSSNRRSGIVTNLFHNKNLYSSLILNTGRLPPYPPRLHPPYYFGLLPFGPPTLFNPYYRPPRLTYPPVLPRNTDGSPSISNRFCICDSASSCSIKCHFSPNYNLEQQ